MMARQVAIECVSSIGHVHVALLLFAATPVRAQADTRPAEPSHDCNALPHLTLLSTSLSMSVHPRLPVSQSSLPVIATALLQTRCANPPFPGQRRGINLSCV